MAGHSKWAKVKHFKGAVDAKRGKIFYGCSGYPNCDFVLWKKPVPNPCPRCHRPYRLESITKRSGARLVCDNPECGHAEPIEDTKEADTAAVTS